jgi:hypothetical protein
MEECPCNNCIVLAICIAKARQSKELFIAHAGATCELFRNYVMKPGPHNINVDHANEAGKLFGYEVVRDKVKARSK